MKSSVDEYAGATAGLQEFGDMLCRLIGELVHHAGIQTHSIAYRVKDIDSAMKKMRSHPDKYTSIDELTDLLGVRVITYFEDDVDRVAKVLSDQFGIDQENSVDKRKDLGADRFGYMSLHFIAALSSQRLAMIEYQRFSGMRFELQIRSILQHAWAEIEHDLGYKAEGALPVVTRRRFSRLASLFELADDEFVRLRNELGEYEESVEEAIATAPETLLIDQSTVAAALATEKSLIELDAAVAAVAHRELAKKVEPSNIGHEAATLRSMGITDIEQLLKVARNLKPYVACFAKHWLSGRAVTRKDEMARGIGLFYLCYVMIGLSPASPPTGWSKHIATDRKTLVPRIRTTWKAVIAELGVPKAVN